MAQRKIIRRKTGIPAVGSVPWGTHFCQFYQTKDDLISILVPYFKAGLENNEFCMWVTSEPLRADEAKKALSKVMPDLEKYIKSGQIEIIPHTKWYLKGGAFDSDSVLKGWIDKLNKALNKGFDGLRLTGNTFWLEKEIFQDFTDYEEAVNEVIGNYKMLALCSYSINMCGALEVIDVLNNHQFALIRHEGKWHAIESSELKKTREALRESEAKYQNLFANLIDGFAFHKIVLNRNGKPVDYIFLEVNRAFEKLSGLKAKDIIGKRVTEALPGIKKDPADWIGKYGKVALTGKSLRFEQYSQPLKKWYSVSAYSPEKEYFVTVFDDITERKSAEQALRGALEESHQRGSESSALFKSARAVLKYQDFNKSARIIFDLCKDLIGARAGYVALLDDSGKNNELLFLDSGGMPCTVDQSLPMPIRGLRALAYKTKDAVYENDFFKSRWRKFMPKGHAQLLNVLFAPLIVEGKAVGLLGIANKPGGFNEHDRTISMAFADIAAVALQNSRLWESLKTQKDFTANVIKSSVDGILAFDKEIRYTIWNTGMEQMTGLKSEEVVGKKAFKLFPFLRKIGEEKYIKETLAGKTVISQNRPYEIPSTGIGGFYEAHYAPLRNEKGQVTGGLGIIRDVTERKKFEEKLKHLASFPELNPNPIFEVDFEGNVTYLNPTAKKLFPDLSKKTVSHPLLMNFAEVISGFKRKKRDTFQRDAKAGEMIFEQTIQRVPREETIRFYNLDITERVDAAEKLVTERKILETTMENTNAHLAYLNNDMVFVEVNSTYAIGAGYSKEEIIGKNHFELFPSKENERIFKKVRDTGKPIEYKAKPFEFSDQPWRGITYWDWTLSPVKDESGKVQGLILSLIDVTESIISKQYSDALNKINELMHSTLNFEEIAQKVTEEAAKAIRCEVTGINLRKDDCWERIAFYGLPKIYLGERLPDKKNKVAATVAKTKKPVVIDNALKDKRIDKWFVDKYGIKSTMVFPLIVRAKVVGVLFFNYSTAPVEFSSQQINFAERLAASLALALENARLYENEHRIAETLQKSLLPAEIPKINGLEIKFFYQSASEGAEVGGDFYDVFEIPNIGSGLVMGDVAGKGIGAAAETSKVKHLLRDRASFKFFASDVLSSVNESLFNQKTNVFTALTYVIYNPTTSVIDISNAGNPYPYYLTDDKFIEITGVPVSINKDEAYPSQKIKLKKGDTLIMYTDGLIESRFKGDLFGEERARKFIKKNSSLSLLKLIHGLVQNARNFSQNKLTDDILVIGIRKK